MTTNNKSLKLVVVADWDDTFLASFVLAIEALRQRISNVAAIAVNHHLKVRLKMLEVAAERLLNRLQSLGTIYIVTNSETGWVQVSCVKFLKGLAHFFGGKQAIPVISAIDLYKNKSGGKSTNGAEWKYYAICHILRLESAHDVYLLGIGDSNAERDAINRIRDEMGTTGLDYKSPAKVKMIKMTEHPSIEGLVRELNIINTSLSNFIYSSEEDEMVVSLPFNPFILIEVEENEPVPTEEQTGITRLSEICALPMPEVTNTVHA